MQNLYDEAGEQGFKEGKARVYHWRPMDELPDVYKTSRKIFVVFADTSMLPPASDIPRNYRTDPYCVWNELDQFGAAVVCARWPHHFPPTHFCELPE